MYYSEHAFYMYISQNTCVYYAYLYYSKSTPVIVNNENPNSFSVRRTKIGLRETLLLNCLPCFYCTRSIFTTFSYKLQFAFTPWIMWCMWWLYHKGSGTYNPLKEKISILETFKTKTILFYRAQFQLMQSLKLENIRIWLITSRKNKVSNPLPFSLSLSYPYFMQNLFCAMCLVNNK